MFEKGRPMRKVGKAPERNRCHNRPSSLGNLKGIARFGPPEPPDLSPHVARIPTGACVDGEQTLCGLPLSDLPSSVRVLTPIQARARKAKRKAVCRGCWEELAS